MWTLRGARMGLAAALLTVAAFHSALAAEVKLTNVGATEDAKHVKLTFTFSEAVKPDVTYFYTHNYVGLRATGLQFTSAQLRQEVPPPSEDAARTYRAVRFVQDKESGEIRLYLTKPLTPADAQVVPFDTYTEVTLLKPAGQSKPMTPVSKPDAGPAAPPQTEPASAPTEAAPQPEPAASAEAEDNGDETPPTLRSGSPDEYLQPEPEVQSEPVESQPSEPVAPQHAPQATPPASSAPVSKPVHAQPAPQQTPPTQQQQQQQSPAQQPQAQQRIGGPSYTDFDLDKVPVKQLEFKGTPFREALLALVAGSGYNVVIADDVDNSEVTLNFAQKQLSLKSALDLLAQAFDLTWSLEPDAIVVKAKPQP